MGRSVLPTATIALLFELSTGEPPAKVSDVRMLCEVSELSLIVEVFRRVILLGRRDARKGRRRRQPASHFEPAYEQLTGPHVGLSHERRAGSRR
jgi:hypothetical protein